LRSSAVKPATCSLVRAFRDRHGSRLGAGDLAFEDASVAGGDEDAGEHREDGAQAVSDFRHARDHGGGSAEIEWHE